MLAREWFSAAEIAAMALPGLPTSKGKVLEHAERHGWKKAKREGVDWRNRDGRGGGTEYHFSMLPLSAQLQLVVSQQRQDAVDEAAPRIEALNRDSIWAWFEKLPEARKAKAYEQARILGCVRDLVQAGNRKVPIMQLLAAQFDVQLSTLYNWERRVEGTPRCDWPAYLAGRHVGSTSNRSACSEEAWEFFKADYLRVEQPNISDCYRRLTEVAAARGWTVPSERTMTRRIMALSPALRVLAREGQEALKRLYPAQRRDRSAFAALEAVNADGHKWDVFVRWPDGHIGRPVMVAFQDLYSGKILSRRVDRTENKECVRLAFGDLVETYGIPDHCWLDNGRNFASKWLTGGTPTRFRFKVRDDEPDGIMTQMGVQVHWTMPYSGQSKPIERAFRDFAGGLAKHPAFAGAYTGNNPMAKPENYRSAAVPFDTFMQVLDAGIAEHNARPGRTGGNCRGESFDAVFAKGYAAAMPRKAPAELRRLWLLAAEAITVNRTDGTIALEGNRFWAEFLTAHRGEKVVVRFDPAFLQDDAHVYRLDGVYLGAAPCVHDAGFANVDDARAHARKRKSWMQAQKAMLEAELSLSIQQIAAMLPEVPAPAPMPEPKVVRMVAGNTAIAAPAKARIVEEERSADMLAYQRAMEMQEARLRSPLHLVPDEDSAG